MGGSGGALGELWEGLGELRDVSERINISKNSRSTAPVAVMLFGIIQVYYVIGEQVTWVVKVEPFEPPALSLRPPWSIEVLEHAIDYLGVCYRLPWLEYWSLGLLEYWSIGPRRVLDCAFFLIGLVVLPSALDFLWMCPKQWCENKSGL